jgi:multidrug efflux pump subunit AcrB
MQLVSEAIPGAQVRPEPGLQLAEPELRVTPQDQRLIEAGWSRAQLATVIRALGDGVWVGEHFDGDKRLDVIFRARSWDNPEDLADIPVATAAGTIVPLGGLADIERTVGPSNLRRVDRRRTVSLSVNPPERMTLEEAMAAIEEQVEPGLRAALPADGTIIYGGSADRLKLAIGTMAENFAMALLVLFMLMSALFRSVKDSALVMLCLPLATVGGMAGVQILNLTTFQPLDLLTMIGFIILMGLVVNNAILLVHQTRSAERRGLARADAVRQALGLRLRPVFMSTLTSIFGMLPLVLMPGVGSVIYRGLATVIVGGMSVSTIFTVLLLPSLLRLGEQPVACAARPAARPPATAAAG